MHKDLEEVREWETCRGLGIVENLEGSDSRNEYFQSSKMD